MYSLPHCCVKNLDFFSNSEQKLTWNVVVKILQGSVVTQTTLGGLAIYPRYISRLYKVVQLHKPR